MDKSESIKEIATALCKFQGEVGKIKKGETNPFFKSKYASLADILDVIRQPLAENGLSFVQLPEAEHQLTTLLMHTSGEWIRSTYSMTPAKNDPQGLGSVITYQRRYALGAVLGLNIDEDDDGNAASTPAKPFQKQKPASDANFAGMKKIKPDLTEQRLDQAIDYCINKGEYDIWEKIEASYNYTEAQKEKFINRIKKA